MKKNRKFHFHLMKYINSGAIVLISSFILLYTVIVSGVLHAAGDEENGNYVKTIAQDNSAKNFFVSAFPLPLISDSFTKNGTETEKNQGYAADNVVSGSDAEEIQPSAVSVSSIQDKSIINKDLINTGCSTVTLYNHTDGSVNEYTLDDYVTCALLAEMPTSYSFEALKAQAIACRTYAVYKLLHSSSHEQEAQLCTSSAHCQAYAAKDSVSEERYATARKAVDETSGIIMYYDSQPILAVFHASSEGKTRSSAEVWGGELAYLVPVETYECENPSMTVADGGYGHGVGLSQYGAEDLAQKGYNCYDILAHYYTGIEFGYVS